MTKIVSIATIRFWDDTIVRAWESFSFKDSYTKAIPEFKFQTRPPRNKILDYDKRLQKGEYITIEIDGKQQARPIITNVTKVVNMGGVTFNVEAKGPLCTPSEGSVDPDIAKRFKADTPLAEVVLEAMNPYGFDTIVADEQAMVQAMSGKAIANKAPPVKLKKLTSRDVQAQNGETAYNFCARLFTRVGVVVRTDENGQLILTAPDYDQDVISTVVQSSSLNVSGNRMMNDIVLTDTNDGQFSSCIVQGVGYPIKGTTRANPPVGAADSALDRTIKVLERAGKSAADIDKYVKDLKQLKLPDGVTDDGKKSVKKFSKAPRVEYEPEHPTYLSTAAPYKPKYYKDKECRDVTRCQSMARLILGARARNAFSVECTVPGFVSTTGYIWQVNTLVRVIVEILDFDQDMWVLSRTFNENRRDGQFTTLKLLPKGALVLGDAPS